MTFRAQLTGHAANNQYRSSATLSTNEIDVDCTKASVSAIRWASRSHHGTRRPA